jgi:hypothetical protein
MERSEALALVKPPQKPNNSPIRPMNLIAFLLALKSSGEAQYFHEDVEGIQTHLIDWISMKGKGLANIFFACHPSPSLTASNNR